MLTLLSWILFRLPTVFMAEVLLTVVLKRRGVKRRLLWIIGSYLLCLGAALGFGVIRPDQFGFGFIPLLFTAAPWRTLPLHMLPSVLITDATQLYWGPLLCCMLFVLIDRLGYPKHSTKISGRHATT